VGFVGEQKAFRDAFDSLPFVVAEAVITSNCARRSSSGSAFVDVEERRVGAET
jgi:hypothetical protein